VEENLTGAAKLPAMCSACHDFDELRGTSDVADVITQDTLGSDRPEMPLERAVGESSRWLCTSGAHLWSALPANTPSTSMQSNLFDSEGFLSRFLLISTTAQVQIKQQQASSATMTHSPTQPHQGRMASIDSSPWSPCAQQRVAGDSRAGGDRVGAAGTVGGRRAGEC